LRLAFLTPDWTPNGGVATHVRLVAAALTAAGHRVHVLYRNPSDGLTEPGVTIEPLKPSPDGVLDQLMAFRPDVVHFHAVNDVEIEQRALREFPAIKTFHVFDYCPSGTKFHHALDRNCTFETSIACVPRQAYLRCTLSKRPPVWWRQYRHAATLNVHNQAYKRLIVASEFVKDEAVRTGYDPAKIAVVPYFTALPGAVTSPRPNHVLFVGRLTHEKGVDFLFDALARLTGDWTCTVVGDGMAAGKLRADAARRGISGRITFAGWLNGRALEAEFEAASVVAVPSRWPEPFGIVGIEAMAHRRPVVAFRVGGIPDWLADETTGFAVTPFDTAAFGERLQWLFAHPADAASMGQAGYERVAREFDARAHLSRLMPIYQELSDRR
jgi:glycosyltransferase involved in cell wall biosynthesis